MKTVSNVIPLDVNSIRKYKIEEMEVSLTNTEELESLKYWKKRYIWLLEKYNELLQKEVSF